MRDKPIHNVSGGSTGVKGKAVYQFQLWINGVGAAQKKGVDAVGGASFYFVC